jgi:hypothetical protein
MAIDAELAITRVQMFYDTMDRSRARFDMRNTQFSYLDDPLYLQAEAELNEQIALVERIAAEFDSGLASRIRSKSTSGWGHYEKVRACQELLGRLKNVEEEEAIFGVRGPQLSAVDMHPGCGVSLPHCGMTAIGEKQSRPQQQQSLIRTCRQSSTRQRDSAEGFG